MSPNCQAFFIAQAGLFDVNIQITNSMNHPQRFMLFPACIRVSDQYVAWCQFPGTHLNALNVRIRIAANFELKLSVALGAISVDAVGHRFRSSLRDRAIECEVVVVTPTKQRGYRLPACLTQQVPTGHVDGRLHIWMTTHRLIHLLINKTKLRWIEAEQMSCYFANAGSCAFGVGG